MPIQDKEKTCVRRLVGLFFKFEDRRIFFNFALWSIKMMKKRSVATCVAVGLLLSSQAFACGIQGTAVNSDGSKIDGTGKISTSWNSKKAYPRNGSYSLDLGSSVCGEKITVYLDGNQGKRVTVSGWTTVNYVRR